MAESLIKSLTVIVTVYNTEKYLQKCLESIVNQTHQMKQLILIDDGSFDGSGALCDEYGCRYKYIEVFHQSNKGQMEAQKKAMKLAEGDYVTFVDSDDWIEFDYIEKFMIEQLDEEYDAIISNSIIIEEKNKQKKDKCSVLSGVYDNERLMENVSKFLVRDEVQLLPGFFAFLPGKIYKKEKLKPYFENVDGRIRLGQDGAVTFPYILNSHKILVVDNPGYHYIQRDTSVSNSPDFNYFEELKILQNHLYQAAENLCESSKIKRQFSIYIRELLLNTIKKIYGVDMGRISCIAPYYYLEKEEKIVIYGAGVVGQAFVKQIVNNQYAQIVGWVDSHIQDEMYGICIDNPDRLRTLEFDHVIVAVNDVETAEQMKEALLEKGVPLYKIISVPIYWG